MQRNTKVCNLNIHILFRILYSLYAHVNKADGCPLLENPKFYVKGIKHFFDNYWDVNIYLMQLLCVIILTETEGNAAVVLLLTMFKEDTQALVSIGDVSPESSYE